MRVLLAVLIALLTLFLAAPVATAVYQPPPICPACTVIAALVVNCAEAEAGQALAGPGCAIENQEEQCVKDEANQDLFDDGAGCDYVNWRQHDVECQVRAIEALLGLASHC